MTPDQQLRDFLMRLNKCRARQRLGIPRETLETLDGIKEILALLETNSVVPAAMVDLLDQMAGAIKVVIDQCNEGDGFTEQAALNLAGALAAYNKLKKGK